MRRLVFALGILTLSACSSDKVKEKEVVVEENLSVDGLGIEVSADQNREYSFTDKKSGYWYARTSQQKHSGMFDGWTVMRNHIFTDYTLFVNDKELIRSDAVVSPDK